MLEEEAKRRSLFHRRLHTDLAYHCHHMQLVAEDYRSSIGHLSPAASSTVSFHSALKWATVDTASLDAEYWVNNLISPVLFAAVFLSLCNLNAGNGEEASIDTVIEFGPHPALKGPIRQILSAKEVSASKVSYLPTLLRGEDALNTMLDTAGALFMKGNPTHLPTINFPTPDPLMPEVLSDLQPYP